MARQPGFSLIELAMVLFIISLLLGGLLMPLATQLEARQRGEALEQLEVIKEALIGFAIVNGRLPCYTTQVDPTNAAYGEEDAACNPTALTADATRQRVDGILPWKTLGLNSGLDPWGLQRTASADPWLGYWRYRVDSQFLATFSLTTGFTAPSEQIDIVDSAGNALNAASEYPVVIIYSTGANRAEDGQNATYEQTLADNPVYQGSEATAAFDDIVVWIGRPILFGRMVAAGALP